MKPCAVATALLLACLLAGPLQAATVVRYFQTDARYAYRTELLRLALDKTRATDGPYALRPCHGGGQLATARGLVLVEKGAADVFSLATTAELERRFIPVRIDIMRGILGYRIFLIHRDSVAAFKAVKSLDQLRQQFVAGFGAAWPDLAILQAGGLSVEPVDVYESLFPMLAFKRFDYFPRGINEIWDEQLTWGRRYPQLRVEESLALYYPMTVYFFVSKHNPALAKRLERGLQLVLADGSFRALFLKSHGQAIRQSRLERRRLFRLKNPTLPPGTPDPEPGWWLKQRL
ncbi:MAG: hypothetical protein BWY87_00273 [Deltaproteobacteria bacterium ADurb.Bin510]|nr:MAG: hypothetical protein BWY87_00273 [Deltaproteobacteria bacterium ADurb.Bin510]